MELWGGRRYDRRRTALVHHLPAYVALERWAATRRVVVVAPTDASGPRRLLAAGARGVIVVGGDVGSIPGVEHHQGVPTLPLGDATIDMVLCVEAYAGLDDDARAQLLREAYRVLRPGGLFAAWIRHPPGPDDRVDFWTLEEELARVYERTYMVAQMRWSGFSLAPVVDTDPEQSPPTLTLDEGLLDHAPEASHYLAVAFRQRPPARLVERLTSECLLVPMPDEPIRVAAPVVDGAELGRLRDELSRAQEQRRELAEARGSLEVELVDAQARALELERERQGQRDVARSEAEARAEQLEAAQSEAAARAKQLEAARSEAEARAEQLEAAQSEAEARGRERDHALARDLAKAQREAEQARARARALEEDLGRRMQTLQQEVERAHDRARALDAGLEQRVAVLQEQAERATARAEALEASLAAARADAEEGGELEALRLRVIELEGLRGRILELEREGAALQQERDRLRSQGEALQQERDELRSQGEALTQERDQLRARGDTLTQERDRLRSQGEGLQRERDALQVERGDLVEQLRTKATDLTVLTGTVNDLEQSLARMSERVEARTRELESRASTYAELSKRHDALSAERDGLTRQVEVVIAEREGARQLAARAEAELEQLRRRHGEQQERLADKVQEASQLSGELRALRERLTHQETMLDQTRSRAEELTASAAKGFEQGRMLAEVARDRDHLREELSRRSAEIDKLEERLWEAREEVQKERLDAVRQTGDLERLREQAERTREAEKARNRELEQLSLELRRLEVERAEAQGLLKSRDEEVARLRRDLEAMSGESADLAALREDLQARSRELADRTEQLQQARAREQDAIAQARRRESQLADAGAQLEQMRRSAEEQAGMSGSLRSELDVRSLESEQLAASVADLQRLVEDLREARREAQANAEQLQRRLELDAAEQDALRRRLRAREQELEDLVSANESSGVELYKLRRELEAAAQANEQLEEALRLQPNVEEGPTLLQEQQWPDEAIAEIRRLKGMLAERMRRHAEQLARVEALAGPVETGSADSQGARMKLLELEVSVRSEEQEYLLGLLEGAEQKIWEMTDAADRNAARLAAGLAQLEKHKEQIDELHDELEVSRNLLSAAQARGLEQERLLASERHKLARAGIGLDGLPPSIRNSDPGLEVDQLFADLDGSDTSLVELEPSRSAAGREEAGIPETIVVDRSSSTPISARSNSRMVIEAFGEDEDWPEPPAGLEDVGLDPTRKRTATPPPRPRPTLTSPPRVTLVRDGAGDADPEGSTGGS